MDDPWLERVLAEPHDAGLRVVWADALQERGDPRGELIALQLAAQAAPLTPAQDKRLRSLLAKHRLEWLGPLAPIVQTREGLELDRGVLAGCQIQIKSVPALATLVGHPLWATLQRIWFCDKFAWDPRIVPLLVHPIMRELRSVTCIGANNVFPALANHGSPLPFTDIWLYDDIYRQRVTSIRDVGDAPGLPALRRLGFQVRRDSPATILDLPIVRRIETLGITCFTSAAAWLEPTRSVANLQTLEFRNFWFPEQGPQRSHVMLRFTRGTGGRWTHVHAEPVGRNVEQMLRREVDALDANALEEITAPDALASYFTKFKRARIIPSSTAEQARSSPAPTPKRTKSHPRRRAKR